MSASIIIYHNPKCSKSRATMELLEARGIDIETRLYLDSGVSEQEIAQISQLLGVEVTEFMRKKDDLFKSLASVSGVNWAEELIKEPKLLERPIIIYNDKAVIGRPPENIEKLF
jgi:arsenate reductase